MTKKTPAVKETALEKLDVFFEGKQSKVLWSGMFLTFILGLLLFEPKISLGGDDSMYINRGYNFITKSQFPTFQGPLYPMVLGLIIYAVGMKLMVLKFFSLFCLLVAQWFTFKLFRDHLSPFTLFFLILLLSTSAALLYYGSATYNETFYLCIQSIFLYYFTKSFVGSGLPDTGLKKMLPGLLISALLLLTLAITKNIGLVAVLAAALYFLLIKNWKYALMLLGSFVVLMLIFNVLKSTFWDIKDIQISNQLNTLMNKNAYKPQDGTEDLAGYVTRLVKNSEVYLGYHFRNIFGLASNEAITGNAVVALFIYIIFIAGFITFFKRSRFWLFIGLFTAVSFGVTFVILQITWIQERLIIVFAPLLLAYLLHVLHHYFSHSLRRYANILVVFFGILLAANLFRTVTRIPEQARASSKYMSGDHYYGFTVDWINYLKMTKWTSDHLPKESFVACRKPGMAFIYSGGKDFFGIWNVPTTDPEALYKRLKDAGVTHVIMANLRTNPDDPNSRVINTVQRYLGAIHNLYPEKLTLVHQIGDEWPAYLYKLD
ncbi:MAG: hypothetical protein HC819_20320 [Cyclobacteriaceae bacterium]|nr:hypothetical protein [Cyclobacteriaceae bacterium]